MGYRILALLRLIKRCTITGPAYLWPYRRTIWFLLRTRGARTAYVFILAKLFARGEWSGIGILDPLWQAFPRLSPRPFSSYPYHFEIEITTRCDLRCIMCEHTHWERDRYTDVDMSFEDLKKIVDQFPNLIWINVTGEGSGYLNKDFPKILRFLKSKPVFVTFVDSFTALREDILRELIEIGVDKITVSIDGATKETYEVIRIGASFDKMLGNVRRILQLKAELNSPLPEICFRYTLMTINAHEMIQFVELIHSLGHKSLLGDQPLIEFVGLLEFESTKHLLHEPSNQEVDAVNRRARELGVKVQWDHPSHQAVLKPPMRRCVVWSEPYIMMGGFVVSCCAVLMSNGRNFLRKHSFGNVFESCVKDIWDSPRYKRFREMVTNDTGQVPLLCEGCRAYDTTVRENRYGVSKWI